MIITFLLFQDFSLGPKILFTAVLLQSPKATEFISESDVIVTKDQKILSSIQARNRRHYHRHIWSADYFLC